MKPGTPPEVFDGQQIHLIGLTILLALTYFLWNSMDRPAPIIFWACVAIPVLHQVFVWISWRVELKNSTVQKTIGVKAYYVIFFIFLVSRVVSVLVLGWVDSNTLEIPLLLRLTGAIILGFLWLYLVVSVKKYFGFQRAAGADHFSPKYRELPLVKKGIFRFTSNGMYVFGFLIFWAIAMAFQSSACFVVAAFSHAYIWIHYYGTEKPDMDYLYSSDELIS